MKKRLCDSCIHSECSKSDNPISTVVSCGVTVGCLDYKRGDIMSKEMINHPSHYNQGKYEAIDVIEDWQLNFNLGNTVKYISRAGHKDDIIQDLKKASWYLDREIKRLEKGE